MKVLIMGGTGVISTHVRRLLEKYNNEVTVINRGNKATESDSRARYIKADINNIELLKEALRGECFDVALDFIAFNTSDVLKRYELLKGKLRQYIFISSATVYNVKSGTVTENSPVGNDFNDYAQKKLECERLLLKELNGPDFPITIVRPSHTYDSTRVPLGIHGKNGSWQNVKRIIEGKSVIIHDSGEGLWAMLRSEDFAALLYGIIGRTEAIGEIFHIASEESLSWKRIYSIVADELDVPLNACYVPSEILVKEGQEFNLGAKLFGDKARSLIFNAEKIKRMAGEYHCMYSMEAGIRDSVRNVVNYAEFQKEDIVFDAWCDKIAKAYR